MLPPPDELRAWIGAHEVCFEISPHYEVHDHRRLQVGFDLSLIAVVPSKPAAGSPETRAVHERLREMALSVLPEGARHVVDPFDAAYHLRREHEFQPEVQLVVQLRHSHGTFDEVDEKDRAMLGTICDALRGLGAQERVWRHTPNP